MLAGCAQFGTDGLSLRADRSITITTPKNRMRLPLPLQVAWTDTAPRAGGSYVVLIDRSPMPPGETVHWFAKGDADCATTPSCPDALYLARRGVTVTSATSVSIAIVPPLVGSRSSNFHELTVVRLGADGRRDGETAANSLFKVSTP
jgi:hypothetical protein